MTNNQETQVILKSGKLPREQLRLPDLRYVVIDDWISKLGKIKETDTPKKIYNQGQTALMAWLHLITMATRTDKNREYDQVKDSLSNIADRLFMSKNKFYEQVIPALWNYQLIDIIDGEQKAANAHTPKNIVIYDAPQNDSSLLSKPLEKVRDYATQYNSQERTHALKKKKKAATDPGDTVQKMDGQNDTVQKIDGQFTPYKKWTVHRTKNEHNNVLKRSFNVLNKRSLVSSSSSEMEIEKMVDQKEKELKEKYPLVNFEEVKNFLLQDQSVDMRTHKQYMALITHRMEHAEQVRLAKLDKPKIAREPKIYPSSSYKKPTREEKVPEWFNQDQKESTPVQENSSVDIAAERERLKRWQEEQKAKNNQ